MSFSACASTGAPREVQLHDLEPTFTRRTITGSHDVYVLKREGGGFITKVCMNYQESGSRIWRNSCRKNVTRSISLMNPVSMPSTSSYVMGQAGQTPPLHTNAVIAEEVERLENGYNAAINGRVVIRDLEEGEVLELQREMPAAAEPSPEDEV
ncbi:MAG: hypothetical protein AAFX94_20015 [Myxococcota bacterium]